MQENNKLEIIVITTKGCVGCQIMNSLLKQATAIFNNKKPIDCAINNFDIEVCPKNLRSYLSDFPTTLFKYNGLIVDKITGTTTVKDIIDRLNKL